MLPLHQADGSQKRGISIHNKLQMMLEKSTSKINAHHCKQNERRNDDFIFLYSIIQ
jgi:hypothetical protein